ncbi:MAG: aminotransferase class V-fold PLP-dependent enzyme [Oscillospiraceae bacterium]|nr:aminotransferase class V-fold PLP-dependent enzyme [Oscillospiraceae bacterium]
MLYFDNAATTFPKPASVRKAVEEAFYCFGANPGRSGHKMGMETAKKVFETRKKAADFFGLSESENLVFTKNCTEALNIVLMSIGSEGGHFIISDLEHNSVLRPLFELKKLGKADFSVAEVFESEPEKTVESFRKLIRSDTKMIVATGSSNVFGIKLPIKMLAKLAHENGILFLADMAQTAGSEHMDMEKTGVDFICAPGHKGLLGPMGTGILAAKRPELLKPHLFGGTGSYSLLPNQPEDLPEMLESGTLNVPGICGLFAGIEKVVSEGEDKISEREIGLAQKLYSEISKIKNATLFTGFPEKETHSAVVSFVLGDLSGEKTAEKLSEKGVASRGGFHCSALAHQKMNTEKRGTCRLSIGPLNTEEEILKLIGIIHGISKNI